MRLQKLHLKTSGIFTCEVSSEAPRFSTATGAGTMNVSIVHNKQSAFFPKQALLLLLIKGLIICITN